MTLFVVVLANEFDAAKKMRAPHPLRPRENRVAWARCRDHRPRRRAA
jgi:hypothetical protein